MILVRVELVALFLAGVGVRREPAGRVRAALLRFDGADGYSGKVFLHTMLRIINIRVVINGCCSPHCRSTVCPSRMVLLGDILTDLLLADSRACLINFPLSRRFRRYLAPALAARCFEVLPGRTGPSFSGSGNTFLLSRTGKECSATFLDRGRHLEGAAAHTFCLPPRPLRRRKP